MATNQRKHQSLPSPSDEPKTKRSTVVQPRKLADLNEHVLEEIFSYLDVEDLVNVVTSDKVFLISARSAFKRKFDSIRIPYKDGNTNKGFSDAMLLRYFGESMSILEVALERDFSNSLCQHIFNLVGQHCCESLTGLIILYPTVDFKFDKSFTEVRQLILYSGHLNLTSSQLVRWFPSLETLELHAINDVEWLLKSEQRITSLQSIRLNVGDGPLYRIQDLNNFMAVNSHLNGIHLDLCDHTFKGRMLTNSQNETDADELMSVKLCIDEDQFEHSTSLAQLKIPHERIAHLDLHFCELTAQICDFVSSCANIQSLKIKLKVYSWSDYSAFLESGRINLKKFSSLTELELLLAINSSFFAFALELIEPLLGEVRQLDTVTVRLKTYTGKRPYFPLFDAIQQRIDPRIWSFTQNISRSEISFTLTKVLA